MTADNYHKIAAANETKYSYWPVDVTNEKEVSDTIAAAAEGLRYPLRGVVTCAGISGENDAVDYHPAAFRKLLDVNVMGTVLVVQKAARVMQKQKNSGSIVLVASISGHIANKACRACISNHYFPNSDLNQAVNTAAYNSSKSAILQLARSLAAEWGTREDGSSIRVNSLSPGYIETPLSAGSRENPETLKQWIGDNMLHRISKPDEYRAPVLFLLGDGSSFMTGADLRVDGGHCAW